MLITDERSVYFNPLIYLVQFSLFQFSSIQFGLPRSNLVCFGPFQFNQIHSIYFSQFILIRFIWFTSICFDPFNLLRSHLVHFTPFHPIRCNLVYQVQFVPLRSIQFNLVHSIQFSLFGPLQTTWSISNHFCPIRCTYLRMEKCKFGLRLLSII